MEKKRARRIGGFVALLAGAALSACGLNELGIVSSEIGTDASTPADDAAADATSSDATASDGAMPSDGTLEDAPKLDAGPLDAALDSPIDSPADSPADGPDSAAFCTTVSPTPTFCADFDNAADASPTAGWDSEILDGGSSVALSTTTKKSPPRALHATSTIGGSADVMKSFAMTSQVSVDFDVLFTALPATGDISPIRITPPAYPGMDVYYFVHTGGSYFQEYGDDFSPSLAAPSLSVWHHVSIAITTNGTTSTITTSMDGAAGWTNHTLLHTWPTPTTAILQIGLPDLYQVTTADAFVDNVVVRVQ